MLTFNVWDENREPDETVDAIIRSNADVVLLQEFFGLGVREQRTLAAAYPYAAEVMTTNMLARDAGEGIDAFLAKREPVWHDR